MAAPIFTAAEIAFLLSCEKVAANDTAEAMEYFPTRETAPGVATSNVSLSVPRANEIELVQLTVQQTLEQGVDAFTINFSAKLKNRPAQVFARYDIHPGDHEYLNGIRVMPYQAHRHVYSAEMVARGDLIDWQRVPEIIDIGQGGPIRIMHERLKRKAIDDLNVVFHTDQMQLYFPRL